MRVRTNDYKVKVEGTTFLPLPSIKGEVQVVVTKVLFKEINCIARVAGQSFFGIGSATRESASEEIEIARWMAFFF